MLRTPPGDERPSAAVRAGRLSIKARLTAVYGTLFSLTGITLLTINYLLIRASIPPALDLPPTAAPAGAEGARGPGAAVIVTAAPVASGSDEPVYSGAINGSLAQYRSSVLDTMLWQSVVAVVVTVVAALLAGWFVAGRALRPVGLITATARRLGADTLGSGRIALAGPRDELTDLADTFDEMLDRLAHAFDGQRRFVANASHELRTPLAIQRTLIEVALDDPRSDATSRRLAQQLLTMNHRSEQLIDGLLVLARSEHALPDLRPVRVDELVERAVAVARGDATDVSIATHVSPRTVVGDRGLLERLITNLVQNAVVHNVPGGSVVVTIPPDGPVIEVSNTGPDVPATEIPALFQPFRRGGAQRTGSDRGSGLGLSIVASVTAAHGGTVTAGPRPGGGLAVSVSLPDHPPSPDANR